MKFGLGKNKEKNPKQNVGDEFDAKNGASRNARVQSRKVTQENVEALYGSELDAGRNENLRGYEMAKSVGKVTVNMEQGQVNGMEVKQAESPDDERQRRKLATALLVGLDRRNPMRNEAMARAMSNHDSDITNEQYRTLIDLMAQGRIGREQGREVISRIERPVDRLGMSGVFGLINAVGPERGGETKIKHMKRILGYFSGTGFDHYGEVNASDVAMFFSRFGDAASFDEASATFLRGINNAMNTPEVVAEYKEAMDDFKVLMFGKEQEYLEQFKTMEKQAAKRKFEIEKKREQLVAESSVGQIPKSVVMKSKHRSLRVEDIETVSEDGEDRVYEDAKNGVFAIFDGVGGDKNGGLASQVACNFMKQIEPERLERGEGLARALGEMNKEVIKTNNRTTAVMVKVNRHESGRKYLSYASVGDSRIYILRPDGKILPQVKDEGLVNVVWNVLGMPKEDCIKTRRSLGVPDRGGEICLQYGDTWLEPGDRVILCSDGVTGDRPPSENDYGDVLPDSFVARLASARTPEQARNNLLTRALKKDDRSAIVFDV